MPENTPMEPKETTFLSNGRELLAALLTYVLGYLYMEGIFHYRSYTALVLFCILFTVMGLIYFRDRLQNKEHWIWLGCLWLCLLSELLGRNQAWGSIYILFVHAFAIRKNDRRSKQCVFASGCHQRFACNTVSSVLHFFQNPGFSMGNPESTQ